MSSNSYFPNYFSVSDILATEERIMCKFEHELANLGFLDVTSDKENLEAGTKMEVPFWLAQSLYRRRQPIVSIEIPKTYKEGYREILQADASAVTLSKWNPYYYELGMLLSQWGLQESEKIKESLTSTYKSRIRFVMDWAHNSQSDPLIGNKLPLLEKNLYYTGYRARVHLTAWLNQGCGNIKKSQLVANLMKKRKRDELEAD